MGDLCKHMRDSLCFARDLFGDRDVVGVEVGVDEGEHANRILLEWANVKKLYLVDPINNIHDRFKSEGGRVEFIHEYSWEGSKRFDDSSLDFVYLDGNHSKDAVDGDLRLWYPKLKVGGVICGHDYSSNPENDVNRAVAEFFKLKGLTLCEGGPDFWGVKNV